MQKIYLAGGCFWGMEELFRQQPGVTDTEAGYAEGGGKSKISTYLDKSTEALEVTFDPAITSYEEILKYFFKIHDPTTLNRQGNDVGRMYRSAIFYQNENEKDTAQAVINIVDNSGKWDKPVTTALEPLSSFDVAEEFHQDFLQKHPNSYTCHYEREFKFE